MMLEYKEKWENNKIQIKIINNKNAVQNKIKVHKV
jgi:hypothetical protein